MSDTHLSDEYMAQGVHTVCVKKVAGAEHCQPVINKFQDMHSALDKRVSTQTHKLPSVAWRVWRAACAECRPVCNVYSVQCPH